MRLKIRITIFLWITGFAVLCAQSPTESNSFLSSINQKLDFAVKQEIKMAKSVQGKLGKFPVTIDKKGELVLCDTTSWTCGFFPGTLWYLYEYSK